MWLPDIVDMMCRASRGPCCQGSLRADGSTGSRSHNYVGGQIARSLLVLNINEAASETMVSGSFRLVQAPLRIIDAQFRKAGATNTCGVRRVVGAHQMK